MARLTPEQEAQRKRASDMRFEAAQISRLLKSDAKVTAKKRKQLESQMQTLFADARAIVDSLPKIDPWGNVKE